MDLSERVTITYLEMVDRKDHRPPDRKVRDLEVIEARINYPSLNKAFYQWVGRDWKWTEKLGWTDNQWAEYVSRVRTYIGYWKGTPVGYFEIEIGNTREIEIQYFGLIPQFIGQGLGADFLSRAIDICWTHPIDRIWLHTCTQDHPAALTNYLRRGFQVFKTETRGPLTNQ